MLSTIGKRMSSFAAANFSPSVVHPKEYKINGDPSTQEPQANPVFGTRSLREVLNDANNISIATTARLLIEYMSDPGLEEVMHLPSDELYQIMNILQKASEIFLNDIFL